MDAGLADLAALVRRPEAVGDLARGALLIARVEYPHLAPEPWLARLDRLAEASGAGTIGDSLRALHRLREFLFDDEGFGGNRQDYYDPRNIYLNDVLERRVGIPVTLGVVMIEVGWRVGLPIVGVGFPGHFLVRAEVKPEPVLLDPFDGGTVVTPERAADLVTRVFGPGAELVPSYLAPVGRHHILTRMLLNLRTAYCQREKWDRALAVVERLMVVDPDTPSHRRDRGTMLMKLGYVHHGAAEWEEYLTNHPEAEDAEFLRDQLRRVRRYLAARS